MDENRFIINFMKKLRMKVFSVKIYLFFFSKLIKITTSGKTNEKLTAMNNLM